MRALAQRLLRIFTIVTAVAVVVMVSRHVGSRSTTFGQSDFLPFYCAGQVLDAGGDPYLAVPLAACERSLTSGTPPVDEPIPAPLPPFTLMLLGVAARVPYLVAAGSMTACIALACGIAIFALQRVTRVSWWALATILTIGGFERNAEFGQIAPLCLATSALAGLALDRSRPAVAGVLAVLTFLQPNAAVPIVVSLFLWVPGSRLALVAGCAGIALAGLAAGGVPATLEYVRGVLPAQGLAEVMSPNQHSLTWLAWYFGAPDGIATKVGAAGYALAAALAIVAAPRLAASLETPAVLVWLPAASTVAFGAYVHANQFIYVIPLAVLIAVRGFATARVTAWLAILLVTIPFYGQDVAGKCAELALAAVAVWFGLPEATWRMRGAAFAGILLTIAGVTVGTAHLSNRSTRTSSVDAYRASGVDLRLASGELGLGVRREADASPRQLASKVPSWLGLALLIALAAAIARGEPGEKQRARVGNQLRTEGG